MNRKTMTAIVIALCLSLPGAARAGFVTNGSFEQTTGGTMGQIGYNGLTLNGWTSTGYNFLFASGSADTTGVTGQYGNLKLWGPNDGSSNGLPAASPDGGNFIGADGDFDQGAIQQTLTGLTAGSVYSVSFWWAAAQQSGFSGPSTDQWQVSFGSQTQSTGIAMNSSHGFIPWSQETFDFEADGTSDVLSFFAVGTPQGVPPFALLDGVQVSSVPEPSAFVLTSLGLAGVVGFRVRGKLGRKHP